MKVFEKIIRDELMIKCKEKIRVNQHGFLPHKSCTTQMTDFIDSLTLSLNENIRIDDVNFDFARLLIL